MPTGKDGDVLIRRPAMSNSCVMPITLKIDTVAMRFASPKRRFEESANRPRVIFTFRRLDAFVFEIVLLVNC